MPRGRKITDYAGKLQELDAKIQRHKENIVSLEAQRQHILDSQQRANSDKLMEYLARSGLSISDAIAKLENQY